MTDLAAPALPPRYRDATYVAAGAFGQVWRAALEDGRPVAVKVLEASLVGDAEVVWRFGAEYRRLQALDHPAFPAAVEDGLLPDGRPFYAMAFALGRPAADEGPLSAGRAAGVLAGVAQALGYLHGQGLVHGDLKADNVLVADDGSVTVLDVGAASPVGQRGEGIVGTLEYMAPEVLRRDPAAPEADWYAFATLGYQLLTGRTPFVAGPGGAAALVRAQIFEQPPALPAAVREAAAALSTALINGLVKDAGKRQAALPALFEALGLGAPPAAAAALRAGAWIPQPEIEAATRALLSLSDPATAGDEYLDEVVGGDPVNAQVVGPAADVALVGPSGAGRTRALDALRVEARVAGRTWLAAACRGAGDAPGAVVRAFLRQAIAAAMVIPGDAVAAWLESRVPPAWLDLEPRARKLALQGALADTWGAITADLDGPVVALDDWHLADATSREIVAALRAGGGARWAFTLDADAALPAGADPDGATLSAGGVLPPDVETFVLLPWDAAAIAALVAARLGEAAPADLLSALAGAEVQRPGLADALLEHFAASGSLRHDGAGWRFDAAAGTFAGGRGQDPWARLWEGRLTRLPAPALALAQLAAAASHAGPIGAPILGAILGLPADALQAALDAALAAGVLTADDAGVRFAAAPVAAALAAKLPDAPQALTRLARGVLGGPGAIEAAEAPAEATLAELPFAALRTAAALAAGGSDDALAVAVAGVAAQRALDLLALEDARRILQGARARLGDAVPAGQRRALLFAGAEAARLADATDDAAADYEAALALAAGDGAFAARAGLGLAKCRQLKGRYDEALAAASSAEAAAETGLAPALAARAAVTRARIELFMGQGAEARASSGRAVALTAGGASPTVRSAALNLYGALLAQADPTAGPEALKLIREAVALAQGVGDLVGVAAALENQGNAHLALGELAEARAAFSRGAALCKEHGIAVEGLSADMNLALVLTDIGDAPGARALAEDVVARAQALGRAFIETIGMAALGRAELRAARLPEARRALDLALERAVAIKNRLAEAYIRLFRLELAVTAGLAAEARAEAVLVAELVEATGHAEGRDRLDVLNAALALAEGDATAAEAAASSLVEAPNLAIAQAAAQVRAEARLASGDAAGAREDFQRALNIARRWNAPWHQAEAARGHARAAEDAEAAAAWADEALALEANLWAAAGAASILAQLGRPLSQRARGARAALSEALAPLAPADRARVLAAQHLPDDAAAAAPGPSGPPAGRVVDLGSTVAAWLDALLNVVDERAVHERLLAAVVALTKAERGYLLVYERGRMVEAITAGLDYEAEVASGFSSSITEEVLWTGEPVYLVDASADSRWAEAASVRALGLRTVVALPYGTPKQLLGVVYVDREALDPILADEDLRALRLLADIAADRVQGMRAREVAAVALDFERRVASLAIEMALAPAGEARRALLLDAALDLTTARRAYWLAATGVPGGWNALASREGGMSKPGFRPETVSRSVLAHVMETGEADCLVETDQPEGWTPGQSVLALGIRLVWCVPVGLAGEAVYLDADRLDVPDPKGLLARLTTLLTRLTPLV